MHQNSGSFAIVSLVEAIGVFDVDDVEMPQESIWAKFKRLWVEFDLQPERLHGQSG